MNCVLVATIEWGDKREVIASMSASQALLIPGLGDISIPAVETLHMHFIRSGMTVDAADPPNIEPWAVTVSGPYSSASAVQATHAFKPVLRTGANGIGNREAAQFDGVQDYLSVADKNIMGLKRVTSDIDGIDYFVPLTVGEIHFCIETGSSAFIADQTIISFADPTATNNYFRIHINSSGALCIEANDGGTINLLSSSTTTLTTSTKYACRILWTDAAYGMTINNVSQTLSVDSGSDDGKGPGELTNIDNTTLGALLTSSGAADFYEGKIGAVNFGGIVGLTDSEFGPQVHSKIKRLYGA